MLLATAVNSGNFGVQTCIQKLCTKRGEKECFVHRGIRLVCAYVDNFAPVLVVFLVPPTACAQVLGIESFLDFRQGVTDVGVEALLFFDLFDRVYGCGVVFAAKLTGNFRKTEV